MFDFLKHSYKDSRRKFGGQVRPQGINNPEEQDEEMEWFRREIQLRLLMLQEQEARRIREIEQIQRQRQRQREEHEARMARLEEEHQARMERMNKVKKFGKKKIKQ